jgi:RNA polymerase sigma-70 factor (ECF subfamily)
MSGYDGYTDKELLFLVRRSDRTAFTELYDRHWNSVYSQAFRKLNDADVAKDITQEVFIYLWTHRETNLIENLEAYLFSCIRNNIFRLLKKESRFICISDLILEARACCSEADALILQKELVKSYESLIKSMAPAQKLIYEMRFHEDLSTLEIAQQLNISRKTVQNQLTRALTLLRSSLASIAILIISHR